MAGLKNSIKFGLNYTPLIAIDGDIDFATVTKDMFISRLGEQKNHADKELSPPPPPKGSKVNHPKHYNSLDAYCENCDERIECITIFETLPANLATALKYTWRCEHKDNKIEDMQKAIWYLQREIKRTIKLTERKKS